jgi:[ribosomal protein S18]-alanine N-acetyltransferase
MTGPINPYYRAMQETDLDTVLKIEPTIYSHPWTHGNFLDSIRAGHHAWVMTHNQEIIGYAVLMVVLDEAHLLNLSVATPFQNQGLGRALLTHLMSQAVTLNTQYMFLEVRASNTSAIALYKKVGFEEVSVRRGYYPLGVSREDAIIMRVVL